MKDNWPLPVNRILPELAESLRHHNRVILQAPTGAGKTTRVPLHLLENGLFSGKILILEPRRLAASAAAAQMAKLLGEPVGKTVGYRMQLENKTSAETRIEVVTEGILTRMLQTDPELSGIDLVIFDEFHERSIQADLGLALCLQCQEILRDTPLKLLLMSATLDTEYLSQALSAPVVVSDGFLFPVEENYLARPLPDRQFFTVCNQVCQSIFQALSEQSGSLLVFLPGSGEIRQVARTLEEKGLPETSEIHALYGDLSIQQQRKAIEPAENGKRKIVLATNIAETSLTIEGIRVVIDAGLARRAVFDPASGMTRLETRRISRSSADQRRGRAGRLEPGACYRLWTDSEHQRLEATTPAEITEADLASLALEITCWGAQSPDELFWLDLPPAARYQQAIDLLRQLDALDDKGQITSHGQAISRLGAHPRIAHMLLLSRDKNLGMTGCCLAAILSERDLLKARQYPGVDIIDRVQLFESGRLSHDVDRGAFQRAKRLMKQWQQRLRIPSSEVIQPDKVAELLLSAWPDRLAQRRGNSCHYLLSSGQGAELNHDDPLASGEYLVAPLLGGQDSLRNARVFMACAIDKATVYDELLPLIEEKEITQWHQQEQRVLAVRQDCLGSLVLEQQNIPSPSQGLISAALISGIRQTGIHALPWDKETEQLKQRLQFLEQFNDALDEPLPDFSDVGLLNSMEDWLTPFLDGITKLDQLKRLSLKDILLSRLSWNQQQQLDIEAPERWTVPSGSRIRINYQKITEPSISARLQEMFGLLETPRIGFNRIPLTAELLSPAQRPVQITRDLNSFWKNTYHDVKKDLKGRYPKHYWPDDPMTAEPTCRVRPK